MEFLGTIFEFGKKAWEATENWVGYVNGLDANMNKLKRNMDYLSSQENDINVQVSTAEQRSTKRRKKEVEVWQEDVQGIKGDVQTLERQVVGWKNVFSRGKLGKLVVEKIQDVAELQEKGRFSNGLLIDDPTSGRLIPTTASFGESTRARNVEKVWEYLMDDEVRRIGVYGMGGVGKTTIMHHINNRLLNETDDVIWVTVSKALNIRNLQWQIAEALNLNLSNYGDETRRASALYALLSQKKRYVLILDDLWEAFHLDKVGIPEPTKDNGCKLVLTTRSLEVCRKMNCRKIKVELLTEDEALNLFMSKVEEDQTELTPSVKEIATKVSKECARLPLAIVSIAGSMKGVNDIRQWRNALNELISSTKDIRDDEKEVFERLKFSYSRLKDEKLQHCFLYCALYPEDHRIPREELIKYWIAEGLIVEMKSTEAMFDKGHTILNKLIDTCLLEIPTNLEKCVRMHDLIRDMALKITSTSPRFMVQVGEEFVKVPYEDWSEDLERVSLMENNAVELPSRPPICPRLTTFLLTSHEYKLFHINIALRIPDHFFMQMPCLKVLDLSFTDIKSLPKSTTKLENLHTLLLDGCMELKDVPSLEKLKALKELKLTHSQIEEVPQGIEELVNLRNLDISQNIRLHIFPCRKLCGLIQLQELSILNNEVKVSTKELLSLTQLKVLRAQFHNLQELNNYVRSQQWQSLKTYNLGVGIHFDDLGLMTTNCFKETCVHIDDSKNFRSSGVDSVVLPKDVKGLEIRKWNNLISLSDIQSLRDARDLRKCEIKYCDELESMFSSSSSFSEDYQIPLRTLEELRFDNLPNFRVLFDGVVPPHNISFNLKMLRFYKCPQMKNIFPAKLLQNFPNLEVLVVEACDNVEEIIADVETSDAGHRQDYSNTITLRNFKRLEALFCPRIKNIFPAKLLQNFPNLEELLVQECDNVEEIIADVETSDAGHRQDDSNTITLRNFKRLKALRCPRIKNIFPTKLLQNFPNLEELVVEACDNVEEIIADVETSDAGHRQDDSNTITLRNFKRLKALRCPRIKNIFPAKLLQNFPNLEELVVEACDNVEEIIADVETSDAGHRQDDSNTITLRNFKRLKALRCPRIKNIFPAKLLQNFPNLEELAVYDCENVEEVIAEVETSDAGQRQDDSNTITLPNFKRLKLEYLPRLNSIYKGIMACESLECIIVFGCRLVRRLPLSLAMDGDGEEASASAPPALQYIEGPQKWWESLEWDDPHTKTTLDPFYRTFI